MDLECVNFSGTPFECIVPFHSIFFSFEAFSMRTVSYMTRLISTVTDGITTNCKRSPHFCTTVSGKNLFRVRKNVRKKKEKKLCSIHWISVCVIKPVVPMNS